MKSSDFTANAQVQSTLQTTLPLLSRKHFSDIIDDEGHQYVDLVMEGGGVLGIGLVGYTYMLEQVGIRFLRIGGTSAGSINALLLAALDRPERPKAEKILEALANLDLFKFVDGSHWTKGLIKAALKKESFWLLIPRGLFVLGHLLKFLGLNPGDAFLSWLTDILRQNGINSTRELSHRMRTLPKGLRIRGKRPVSVKEADCYLALVSADVTTETKVDFPRMAPLYWGDPPTINPALFVRASMSIPYFFQPVRLHDIPQGDEASQRWKKLVAYDGKIPQTITFVDGGIMSNFPIDLFHNHLSVPAAPTFGAKLGSAHRQSHTTESVGQLGIAAFDSARHCLDYDFIARHPDYSALVAHIDTTGHKWLNFAMADSEKLDLFYQGVVAGAQFLKDFDWKGYKQTRKLMAAAYRSKGG